MPFVEKTIRRALRMVPTAGYRRLVQRDVLGLCYHMVTDRLPPHVAHIMPLKSIDQFEADLRYLKANYDVISYDELGTLKKVTLKKVSGTFFRNGPSGALHKRFLTPFSRPKIILTFDDGYRECLTHIRPLLIKHQIPAIFFVVGDFIDNRHLFYRNKVSLCAERIESATKHQLTELLRLSNLNSAIRDPKSEIIRWIKRLTVQDEATIDLVCQRLEICTKTFLQERQPYLTRDEIKTLAADGFTIGAHSLSHARFSEMDSFEEIEHEIAGSCKVVAELTGAHKVPFAFPFSGDGIDRDQLAKIRERNSQVGLMFDRRGFRKDTDFIVHRIICDSTNQNSPPKSDLPSRFRRAYRAEICGTQARSVSD